MIKRELLFLGDATVVLDGRRVKVEAYYDPDTLADEIERYAAEAWAQQDVVRVAAPGRVLLKAQALLESGTNNIEVTFDGAD